MAEPIVERVKALIDKNPESNMSLSEISDSIGISVYYLSHIFKKTTSMTVVEYRTLRKIERARDLLVSTDMTVTEIAFACGFSSQGYFSERFSKICGTTPTAYRLQNMR